MSYKYNHSIQFDLDHLSQYEDVVGLEEKKRELDHVYAQSAKADEYEAKAKAFDRIVNQRNQAGTDMYGKEDDVVDSVIESAFWNIDGIIVEYESGEPNAEKR